MSTGGAIPPHLRNAVSKTAAASALTPVTNAAADSTTNGDHDALSDERAVVPFAKTARASRGDRSGIKDSYAIIEEAMRASAASLTAEKDRLEDRCDELEAENRALVTRCKELASKNQELVGHCEDLENEKHKFTLRTETLEAENKQLLYAIHDLKHQMQEDQQRLEGSERLAAVKFSQSAIKSAPTQQETSSATSVDTQLSQEQLDDVLRQLLASHAEIQRHADEQASDRYKGVMEAQVAMHANLERRIIAMESSRGDFDDALSRITTVESQVTMVMDKQKNDSASYNVSPAHFAEPDYQSKTKLKALTEDIAKLKAFRERMNQFRNHEQEINEAHGTAGLEKLYNKFSKVIDSNGWDVGDFEKLTMADLHALREHVVMKYAVFNANGRALMALKSRAIVGGSPLSDD